MDRRFYGLAAGNTLFNFSYYFFVCFVTFFPKYRFESAKLAGFYLALVFVGNIGVEPFAAVLVDSGRSRRIVAAVSSAAVVLGAVLLAGLLTEARELLHFAIPVACLVFGAASATVRPAVYARAKYCSDNATLNTYLLGGERLTMILGQALGLILYRTVSPEFLVGSIVFFGLAAILPLSAAFPPDAQGAVSMEKFKEDAVGGLSFIWNEKPILAIFFFLMAVNVVYPPSIAILLPYLIEEVLGLSHIWFSILVAIQGVAVILGMMAVKPLIRDPGVRGGCFRFGLGLIGFGVLCFYGATSPALLVAGSLLTGVGLSCTRLTSLTQLQDVVPVEVAGRTLGFLTTFASALLPASLAVFGFVTDAVDKDVQFLYLLISAVILAFIVPTYSRSMRRFFAPAEAHALAG